MMQAEWARHVGKCRWIIAVQSPIPVNELAHLTNTFHIERVQPLPSGNVAFYLWSNPQNVAQLMELPKPKYGGSRHECNLTRW